ncbi:hypothetical protein [Rubinisphaera italica]
MIKLSVFILFAVYDMKQPVKHDKLWAAFCLAGRCALFSTSRYRMLE